MYKQMTEDLETSIENTEFEFYKSNNTKNEEQKITKKRKITIKKTEKTNEIDQDIIEKLKAYVEPIYSNGIAKTERFDEDNIKPLLRDTNFNKKDRDRLTDYNKHRLSGGYVNVTYKLGSGCEKFQLGRLFPQDGIGLQSYRFDMRNPLAKKNYWDIDIDNCHYRIAKRQCEVKGLKCEFIKKYIDNREHYIKLVSNSRKKAKTEFLKILYGGDIRLYRDDFEDVDGEVNYQGVAFLKDLQVEVNNLMEFIWNENKHLHKLRTGKGKDAKPIDKKPNPKASLMATIFQTEERKILMCMDFILKIFNRNLSVFIHDGGYVEKLEGESVFPQDLLVKVSKLSSYMTKYDITLTQKDITYDWKPSNTSLTPYEVMKGEFEQSYFYVGSQFIHIHKDGYVEEGIKPADLKQRLMYMNWTDYSNDKPQVRYFLDEWLKDRFRSKFARIVFNPDLENTPPDHFNLFKGFSAENFKPEEVLSKTEIALLVKPILFHLGLMVGEEGCGLSKNVLIVLAWMAFKLQHPNIKINVSLLFRAVDELFEAGGGEGKNLIWEWFANEILGEKYFYCVGNNKELYGDFNAQFEGKLLVLVEEANGQTNRQNQDLLKSLQTSKKKNINKKFVNVYQVVDLTDYIFTSNGILPLYIGVGNRRIMAFDCIKKFRLNRTYFMSFTSHLNKPIVKWAFYQYLLNFKTYESSIDFESRIPKTPALLEIQRKCAPLVLKWIIYEIQQGTIRNDYVKPLWETFRDWARTYREGKEEFICGLTAFGQQLSKETEKIFEDEQVNFKTGGRHIIRWNIPVMVKRLKEMGMIDEEFTYHQKIDQGEEGELLE